MKLVEINSLSNNVRADKIILVMNMFAVILRSIT
jgi:hypothetical protein